MYWKLSFSRYRWFISLSEYSTDIFSLEMNQRILSITEDTNGYVVKIENEKGELFLPSYETIAVDFDYIALFVQYMYQEIVMLLVLALEKQV